ncbi:MAG: hypothetical protein JRD89_01570 [Deltaproteobacteria bacterium]|nr:hypothetical protein [Deltaproteobacteria bacterium]
MIEKTAHQLEVEEKRNAWLQDLKAGDLVIVVEPLRDSHPFEIKLIEDGGIYLGFGHGTAAFSQKTGMGQGFFGTNPRPYLEEATPKALAAIKAPPVPWMRPHNTPATQNPGRGLAALAAAAILKKENTVGSTLPAINTLLDREESKTKAEALKALLQAVDTYQEACAPKPEPEPEPEPLKWTPPPGDFTILSDCTLTGQKLTAGDEYRLAGCERYQEDTTKRDAAEQLQGQLLRARRAELCPDYVPDFSTLDKKCHHMQLGTGEWDMDYNVEWKTPGVVYFPEAEARKVLSELQSGFLSI